MRIAYLVDVHGRFDAVARAMGAIGDDLLVTVQEFFRTASQRGHGADDMAAVVAAFEPPR